MTTRRKRRLPRIVDLADTQPTDRVERRDGGVFVVDGNGSYAPVRVEDEEGMDLLGQRRWRTFVAGMESIARVRWHIFTQRAAPISAETLAFRVGVLLERDREIWRAKYGEGVMFAVVDESEEPWSLEKEIAWHKARKQGAG